MTKLICINNSSRYGELTLNKIYFYDDDDFEHISGRYPDDIIDIENDNYSVEGYYVNRFKLYRPVSLSINIRVL